MASTLMPPPELVAPPTGNDRCDRCNASAKLRITTAENGDLVFCGHHANRYAENLAKVTVRYATDPDFTWRGADLMP